MRRLLHIARREYLSYLRTPGFWISLIIGPLVAALGLAAPHITQQASPTPHLIVLDLARTGAGSAIADALTGPAAPARLVDTPADIAAAATPEAAERALRPYLEGRRRGRGGVSVDAAAILTGASDRVSIAFWSRNLNDVSLENVIADAAARAMQQSRLREAGLAPRLILAFQAARPDVRTFSIRAAAGRVSLSDQLPSMLGLGLAFVLFFAIFTGAGILLNSVIEEKSNRVLEVLLTSASVLEILGGKILGAAGLSATVILGWSVVGAAGLAHYAPGLLSQVGGALLAHGLIVWFTLFFFGGYLMYASIFATIGSFCETVREAQTLLGPMMMVMTIPVLFLSLALDHPDAPLIGVLSWIPPFTPFLMTARLAADPPLWQVLGALILMGATAAAVMWLCTHAFRAGALSSGKPDLWRWLSRRRSSALGD